MITDRKSRPPGQAAEGRARPAAASQASVSEPGSRSGLSSGCEADSTVAHVLEAAAMRLAAAGVADAHREARLLAGVALDLRREALIADPARAVDTAAQARLAALTERRARREPMSHILGMREFWSLEFRVTRDVLDPRPDSETLVEAALAQFPERDATLEVLDLGTGSGCLLLAVLSERPRARGLGVDVSPAALDIATANAARLGLDDRCTLRCGDWGAGVGGWFDLVLCNPPYIESAAIEALEPEVARWEPRRALDGGPDGLAAYRALAPQFNRLLRPGRGIAVVEIGAGQAAAVTAIFAAAGLGIVARQCDLSQRVRCIAANVIAPFTNA